MDNNLTKYQKSIQHAILSYSKRNNLDNRGMAEFLGINETTLSKVIHGQRDPITHCMETLKNYAKLFGEEKTSVVKMIAKLENVKLSDEKNMIDEWLKVLQSAYDSVPGKLRRSLVHGRINKFKDGFDSKRWELINIVFMLIMDFDSEKIKLFIPIVKSLHDAYGYKLDKDDEDNINTALTY